MSHIYHEDAGCLKGMRKVQVVLFFMILLKTIIASSIVIDNTVNCLKDRFDQPGYKLYSNLEQLLVMASHQKDIDEPLKFVCDHYHDDFNPDLLQAQLITFSVKSSFKGETINITIFDIIIGVLQWFIGFPTKSAEPSM